MEDQQIVELFWRRDQAAVTETARKYGRYCHAIAYNILHNREDSEECVNDTYLNAWRAMPPQRPERLSAFLGKIARNLSLKRWEKYHAEKRGAGQAALALDELAECVPASGSVEQAIDGLALAEVLDRFLASLPAERRKIFMRRYWYLSSIKEIAAEFGVSQSKVKMSLLRSREALRKTLEKEGIEL